MKSIDSEEDKDKSDEVKTQTPYLESIKKCNHHYTKPYEITKYSYMVIVFVFFLSRLCDTCRKPMQGLHMRNPI